jgi:quinol monooxygenase YgiN
MVVVAGHFRVPAEHKREAVACYQVLVEASRHAPGCMELSISPDPTDPERIVVCEIWANEEQLAAWRRVAPAPQLPDTVEVHSVQMWEYVVATRRQPFSGPYDRDN